MLTKAKYTHIMRNFKNSRTPKLDYLLRNFIIQDGEDERFINEYIKAANFDSTASLPIAVMKMKREYLKEGLSENSWKLLVDDALEQTTPDAEQLRQHLPLFNSFARTSSHIQKRVIEDIKFKVSNADLAKLAPVTWQELYSEFQWYHFGWERFKREFRYIVEDDIWDRL